MTKFMVLLLLLLLAQLFSGLENKTRDMAMLGKEARRASGECEARNPDVAGGGGSMAHSPPISERAQQCRRAGSWCRGQLYVDMLRLKLCLFMYPIIAQQSNATRTSDRGVSHHHTDTCGAIF